MISCRSKLNGQLFRQLCAVAVISALMLGGGKPKPKPKSKDDEPVTSELPADLNKASMRLHAADMIYELDLSSEQMNQLRSAAEDAASDRKRATAGSNEKLAAAFAAFYKALLTHADDQDIAKLRNQAAELVAGDDVHLDDEVEPTDTARSKATGFTRQLTAGQIAAYMASHADQVADPTEKMFAILVELQDSDSPEDADTQIKQTSADVGMLIAGNDAKASAAIADKVSAWVKTNRQLTEDQLTEKRADLLASAKKVIGDVPPMDILSHWMDDEIGILLSNPQLPQAIEAILSAQEH